MTGNTIKIRLSRIKREKFVSYSGNPRMLKKMFGDPSSYGGDYLDLDIKSFKYTGSNKGIKEFSPVWFSNAEVRAFLAGIFAYGTLGASIAAYNAIGNKPMSNIIVDFNQWKEEFTLKGILTPDNPSASNANKNIMEKLSKLRYWTMMSTSGQSKNKESYTMGLMMLYDPVAEESGFDNKEIPYGQAGDIWLGRLAQLPSGNFSATTGKFEYTIKWKTGIVLLA